jgi:hypothetical protein
MNAALKGRRANYFSDEMGEAAFQRSFEKLLARVQKQAFSKYISPENTHRFKHGGQWAHPASPDLLPADMKAHSAETEVSFDKLVNHDLTVIDQVLDQLVESMERQFTQMMYSAVSAAADAVGNTVNAKEAGSPREAFAQALEKLQFSVNRSGDVTLPTIHLGPEALKSLQRSTAEAPTEFHQRIEAIKARKISEALECEAKRKARFVRYGNGE